MNEAYHCEAYEQTGIWAAIGISKQLIWGYIGVALFVMGAMIEQSWFSSYMSALGFSVAQTGLMFTAFGVFVAIASWFTGIATQVWGIRPIMWCGCVVFFMASAAMLFLAIPSGNYYAILLTYMFRGMAYPLFAYSFLVWVNYRTEKKILGRAVSWFWNFFSIGMAIIGPYYAGLMIPRLGEKNVILTGFIFVILGAFCALILNRDKIALPKCDEMPLKEFRDGIAIMFERPRLGISVIVKAINDVGKFGFVILMPMYLADFGFSTSEWLAAWGTINLVNFFANYIFGAIGDKIGWRKTVVAFSGTLCSLATIFIYMVPQWYGHNTAALVAALSLYAIGLSAFGPLSALIPSLAPDKKGAAISCLNLGSGLSNFLGPLLVSVFAAPFGVKGAMTAIGVSYLLASVLASFLKTPEELGEDVLS